MDRWDGGTKQSLDGLGGFRKEPRGGAAQARRQGPLGTAGRDSAGARRARESAGSTARLARGGCSRKALSSLGAGPRRTAMAAGAGSAAAAFLRLLVGLLGGEAAAAAAVLARGRGARD